MNAFRTSLVLAALSIGGLVAAGCSGTPEEAGDPATTGTADLTKTPSPAPPPTSLPTTPSPLPPVPVPPPTQPPGACTGGGFANANGVCSPDAQMLASAEAACGDAKLLITTFSPDEKCGAGSSNSASYSCCPRSTTPPSPPTPPHEGPCTVTAFANANGVCTPDATLKASAESACEAEKRVLSSYSFDEKCGKGGSNSGNFTCCAAAQPQ